MLVAGWVGLSAGWLPHPLAMRGGSRSLAVFGAFWGLAFGALMNLWFWPFTAPGAGDASSLYWSPGLGLAETVERYIRFYLVTSLAFDLARAVGNIVLVLIFAAPIIRLLERYKSRFTWQQWEELDVSPPVDPRSDRHAVDPML
jgi:energy-coupling factor transport system substrate-specific component